MQSVKDICRCIEEFAPLSYQETWDNCGLLVGNSSQAVSSVLLTVDVTEAVVAEAVELGAQMIISHHPVIVSGLMQLTGVTESQRAIALAIKNDIAIYAAHTNIDSAPGGVNYLLAAKLGLSNLHSLSPQAMGLQKLVTFVPFTHYERVREALFEAGAGQIGNYDCCGYSMDGKGSFRPLQGANPVTGELEEMFEDHEIRFETVFPSRLNRKVVDALENTHPYEQPAYDIHMLHNTDHRIGLGLTGMLPFSFDELQFLNRLKETFQTHAIRHTKLRGTKIRKVAICGGSGSSLLDAAIRSNADVFVTGDFKYHQFADAENSILIADIGHFESEQFVKEIFYDILSKKFSNFAAHFSKVKTNPINYL